jgi:hypothetical protein
MKQAVVLIHGIGEQQPMDTVRRFVKAVLTPMGPDEPAYWNKPDRMSELFELRRLQSRGQPATHFFEYYWAYNLSGTKIWDLAVWLFGLVIRPWRDIPPGARTLWLVSRLLLLAAAVFLLLGGGAIWKDWVDSLSKVGAASLLLTGALFLAQYLLVFYLGDAARYLSPRPRNIKLRQKIRSEGIRLLRELHKSGEFDRIILVGHSLGSVIAYDIITHLWQEYHDAVPWAQLEDPLKDKVRRCMKEQVSPQPVIRDELSRTAAQLQADGKGLDDFQKCQLAGWREQRLFGAGWKITDLITLGSPLAHASLLMAGSARDFLERTCDRELPTCPPQRDKHMKGYAYSAPQSYDVGDGKGYTPLILHHAAPFAVTRWTNLYFPAALGLFGDLVGGPLRPVFGLGVKDIPVSTATWRGLAGRTLVAHTSYWRVGDDDKPGAKGKDPRVPALFALRQALDLSNPGEYKV